MLTDLTTAPTAVQRWMVMGMSKCKACGREFASTNTKDEICYPCKNALKRLNGYAVPAVRCKNCKHMKIDRNGYRWCLVWTGINGMGDEGFCNYGERKDNDCK